MNTQKKIKKEQKTTPKSKERLRSPKSAVLARMISKAMIKRTTKAVPEAILKIGNHPTFVCFSIVYFILGFYQQLNNQGLKDFISSFCMIHSFYILSKMMLKKVIVKAPIIEDILSVSLSLFSGYIVPDVLKTGFSYMVLAVGKSKKFKK